MHCTGISAYFMYRFEGQRQHQTVPSKARDLWNAAVSQMLTRPPPPTSRNPLPLHISLSPLTSVTRIGSDFFGDCAGLYTIDMTALSNVRHIGDAFLRRCVNLQTIDLRPLSNVTSIRDAFLEGCRALTVVDASPLVQLEFVCSSGMRVRGRSTCSTTAFP